MSFCCNHTHFFTKIQHLQNAKEAVQFLLLPKMCFFFHLGSNNDVTDFLLCFSCKIEY